jgi:hypothetical protein
MKRATLTATLLASAIAFAGALAPGASAALTELPVDATTNGVTVRGTVSCSPTYVGAQPPYAIITPQCPPPPSPGAPFTQPILPASAGTIVTFTSDGPMTWESAKLSDENGVLATIAVEAQNPSATATAVMPNPLPDALALTVRASWRRESGGETYHGTHGFGFYLRAPTAADEPTPPPPPPPSPPPPPVSTPPTAPPAVPITPSLATSTVKPRGVSVEVVTPFAATITGSLLTRFTPPTRRRARDAARLPRVLGRRVKVTRKAGTTKLWVPYSRQARRALAGRKTTRATLRVTVRPAAGERSRVLKRTLTL